MSDESEATVTDNVGKMLIAGFEGYKLTPNSQGEQLIKKHRVHSFILGAKNFVNAPQIKGLIQSMQDLAKDEGYEQPLLIAVDQELGCCNSMYDGQWLTQFPGAMGLGATDNLDLIYKVGKAVAEELRALGFNVYMGPVLDICSKMANQLIGIRTFGSTREDVTRYGSSFAKGLKAGGILTSAKHYPGTGSSFVDNLLELPMMLETLPQLKATNIQTFKSLMAEGLVDSVHASGFAVPNIAPNEIHACLSPVIIHKLLRKDCKFDGLVMSECLELEALCRNIGLGQGAVMSILYARCDMVMVCNDFLYQKEALDSLRKAYRFGTYELIFQEALRRINATFDKLSWQAGPVMTPYILTEHRLLGEEAYRESITLVRDNEEFLPISKFFSSDKQSSVLLLTPLLTPIHPDAHHICYTDPRTRSLLPGEEVFQDMGERLSNYDKSMNYKVFHTSYTANGLTSTHEALIDNAKAVILVCAEASRNMYQIGVAKHVSVLCGGYKKLNGLLKKPLIIISVTTPYDFLYHRGVASTYICTYDYTWNALRNVPAILFGDLQPTGRIPGEEKSSDFDFAFDTSPSSTSNASLTPLNNNSLEMLLNQTSAKDSITPPPSVSVVTALGRDPDDDGITKPEISTLDSLGVHKRDRSAEASSADFAEPSARSREVRPSNVGSNAVVPSSGSGHRRKRKRMVRPWLVEEFDLNRDFTNLVMLLKNCFGSDVEQMINTEKFKAFLQLTQGLTKHFVVRNSSMNVLLGAVLTWVDMESHNGRIMLICVSRSKRRQCIGDSLHMQAIRYLTMSCGCQTVTLGCDFPLLNFMKTPLVEEVMADWNSSLSKAKTISTPMICFFKAMGWGHSRSPYSRRQPVKKYLLSLELDQWKVPDKLVKQLKVFGVKFEVADDHNEIIEMIRHSNFKTDDDEARFLELYSNASKYIEEEGTKSKNTLIFKVVDPASRNIIGSIILFNNMSKLANWYPFMSMYSLSEPVSYLTGVFSDPAYSSLKSVMKLGLICTGVSFVKKFQVGKVLLDNCVEGDVDELAGSGFKVVQEYISSFGIKMSYEWVI